MLQGSGKNRSPHLEVEMNATKPYQTEENWYPSPVVIYCWICDRVQKGPDGKSLTTIRRNRTVTCDECKEASL